MSWGIHKRRHIYFELLPFFICYTDVVIVVTILYPLQLHKNDFAFVSVCVCVCGERKKGVENANCKKSMKKWRHCVSPSLGFDSKRLLCPLKAFEVFYIHMQKSEEVTEMIKKLRNSAKASLSLLYNLMRKTKMSFFEW